MLRIASGDILVHPPMPHALVKLEKAEGAPHLPQLAGVGLGHQSNYPRSPPQRLNFTAFSMTPNKTIGAATDTPATEPLPYNGDRILIFETSS